jgi:hypothetical protein
MMSAPRPVSTPPVEAVALAGGDELLHGLPVRGEARRKDLPIPRAHHDAAAIAGELVGEVLGIADAKDLGRRIMPEAVRRERDGGHQRFQMTRRQVDDQPPDLALPHSGQLGRDHFDVPVHRERRLRVELEEAALSEVTEIPPQDRVVFGRREIFHSWFTPSHLGAGPGSVG